MEIVLAIGAAVSYGVSDFTGGVLTRRAHVLVVFPLSQLVSAALLLAVVTLMTDAISWPGVSWGPGCRCCLAWQRVSGPDRPR